MRRRKRIALTAIAAVLAFLVGFLSTIRSAPAQSTPEATVMVAR
jgi:multidrug resistance efflux pump